MALSIKLLVALVILCITCIVLFFLMRVTVTTGSYQERHRPQIHFSPHIGWMNDPNGLVYENGVYHLYYQYYPEGMKWNVRMHWGHASSRDLIHWDHHPIAIHPDDNGTIFSGSAIVDADNVTGLADVSSGIQPMIAIYTINDPATKQQSQGIAHSSDHGLTYTKYPGNPVLVNPGKKDFRDPNVARRRNGLYHMSLAAGDRIEFYSSPDLKHWEYLSDFSAGDHAGVWECPALFQMRVVNESPEVLFDVLIVSENDATAGSMTHYFIGKFDGKRFTAEEIRWLDHGPDNYAAVPYYNDPHGRIVVIGWMSNWLYANEIPTRPWNGQMTMTREVRLVRVGGKLFLTQRPIMEGLTSPDKTYSLEEPLHLTANQSVGVWDKLGCKATSTFSLEYEVIVGSPGSGVMSMTFSNDQKENIVFSYDISMRVYIFDRRDSGVTDFSPHFLGKQGVREFARISSGDVVRGRILLDVSSIEVFADDGLNSMTSLFFPSSPYNWLEMRFETGDEKDSVTVSKLTIADLDRIW